jgi:hypothetical protein
MRTENMSTPDPSTETVLPPRETLITLAHVIYALRAFSALTGLVSSVLVLTAFLTGWPSIIAVVLNYAKRAGGGTRGSIRISAGRSARSGARLDDTLGGETDAAVARWAQAHPGVILPGIAPG